MHVVLMGILTRLVFHRGEDDSSLVGLAFGLNTRRDLIMNNSANTAPVAAEPDRISAWDARIALWVRMRTGSATNMEASHMPCSSARLTVARLQRVDS